MGGRGSGGGLRKPNEVKRRLGNPGMRPLPDETNVVGLVPVAAAGPPEPLARLGPAGRRMWDQVSEAASYWLAASDLPLLQMLAETQDDYTVWRLRSLRDPDNWRAAKRVDELRGRLLTFAVELGLSPTARARLGVAEVRMHEGIARLTTPAVVGPKETFA